MAKETYETADYAAMMRRMMKSWGKRCSDDDMEALAELIAFRQLVDQVTGEAVANVMEAHQYSWADVARAAGTSRQSAHERWSRYGKTRCAGQA